MRGSHRSDTGPGELCLWFTRAQGSCVRGSHGPRGAMCVVHTGPGELCAWFTRARGSYVRGSHRSDTGPGPV